MVRANTEIAIPELPQTAPFLTTGTANTSRVHPPTASSVADGPVAGAAGAELKALVFKCTTTNVQGLLQIWKKAVGGNYHLVREIGTTATATVDANIASQEKLWLAPNGRLILAAGECIAVSVTRAEVWEVVPDQASY